MSGYSIGSYNTESIYGNVKLKIAGYGQKYKGMGKELFNIENLPVLYDEKGPFGNPNSDSERTMVNSGFNNIKTVIYSFDTEEELLFYTNEFVRLINMFYKPENINILII